MLAMVLLSCHAVKRVQDPQAFLRQEKIAASQAAAAPLFFTAPQGLSLRPSGFKNAQELAAREGLPNFFAKLQGRRSLTIAFIGGSVTQLENMYRNQTAAWFAQLYPGITFRFINAGVSGSGTELAACRADEQVLRFKPDLVFIEFAVNGSYLPGLEGLIRKIIRHDATTDICLLYATMGGQQQDYMQHRTPANIAGMENIAAHYGLPGIQLGVEVADLIARRQLAFTAADRTSPEQPAFADGVHPTTYGGNIYAGIIARCVQQMQPLDKPLRHSLPPALQPDNWEDGEMLPPEAAGPESGWELTRTTGQPSLQGFAPWFPHLLRSVHPGARLHFRFRGTAFGIFDIGGPETGQLCINVDGQAKPLLNRFNRWCNNRYRGQYDFVYLKPGIHEVEMYSAAEKADKHLLLGPDQQADINAHPDKYDRQVVYLGKLLLKGQLITDEKN